MSPEKQTKSLKRYDSAELIRAGSFTENSPGLSWLFRAWLRERLLPRSRPRDRLIGFRDLLKIGAWESFYRLAFFTDRFRLRLKGMIKGVAARWVKK